MITTITIRNVVFENGKELRLAVEEKHYAEKKPDIAWSVAIDEKIIFPALGDYGRRPKSTYAEASTAFDVVAMGLREYLGYMLCESCSTYKASSKKYVIMYTDSDGEEMDYHEIFCDDCMPKIKKQDGFISATVEY